MARVVITGANRGIGLELTRQFVERGDDVIAACRSASPELSAIDCTIHEGMDVTDEASLARLVEVVGDHPIDILVNNAGILSSETLADLNLDRIRRQFEVNTLGPLRVVNALLKNLKAGSKVAIVSSRVGSLADNGSGGNYGYRMSKTAVNMAGVNLAHDLRSKDVAVFLLHPGYVKTDMTGKSGNVDAATSARGLIDRIDTLTLNESGSFWHAEGYELPW